MEEYWKLRCDTDCYAYPRGSVPPTRTSLAVCSGERKQVQPLVVLPEQDEKPMDSQEQHG